MPVFITHESMPCTCCRKGHVIVDSETAAVVFPCEECLYEPPKLEVSAFLVELKEKEDVVSKRGV